MDVDSDGWFGKMIENYISYHFEVEDFVFHWYEYRLIIKNEIYIDQNWTHEKWSIKK